MVSARVGGRGSHTGGRPTRRSRDLGQNFLRDPNILAVIGREAGLGAPSTPPAEGTSPRTEGKGGDVVLEIGGGEGILSAYLAPRVAHLHVIEIDERLRELLVARVGAAGNVSLVWGDAMKLSLRELQPPPSKLVANLPYGVAASVLLRTIEQLPSIEMWLAMVQREVGERLAASPGGKDYGVSSVLAQLAGEVRVVRNIPRTVFHPVPNVDSVLVRIERNGPAASPRVRALVAGAFAHRRKALARSLELSGSPRSRERIRAALTELGHPADERAERLTPREFVDLARMLDQ